jgi:hypothetical protein
MAMFPSGPTTRRLLLAGVLATFAAMGAAQAQDKKLTPQQERMKSCNAEASGKSLKGDERKAFMSRCLKGEPELTAQQEKMKTCNQRASGQALKGDDRKAFMSKCLRA